MSGPPRPTTYQDMEAIIYAENAPCRCDICKPHLYRPERNSTICCPPRHYEVKLKFQKNRMGHITYRPFLEHSMGYACEVMNLTRRVIEYMDRSYLYMNDEQQHGVDQFVAWAVKRRTDITTIISEPRGSAILSTREARFILQCYNEVFFGGDNPRLIFSWTRMPDRVRGRCRMHTDGSVEIFLNDTSEFHCHLKGHDLLSYISVLLHEATHAFLNYYSCRHCRSGASNLNGAAGHGRPFQLITHKLEEVFPRLLGLPVRLNRWEALVAHWKLTCKHMPSRHDLATWRSFNYLLECEDENDVGILLERTMLLRQYRPGMIRRGM
jgi:hypothetical protein